MRTLTILIALTIGCGDDSMSAPPDGMADARIDAPRPDASPDATSPDAGPTFSGLVLMADFKIQNHPELGHGGALQIQFSENGAGAVPVTHVDATQGGIGCTADLFTAAAIANEGHGLDEGTIHITGSTATIPPCTFVTGAGYLCIGQFGQGSTINVAPGAQGTATVTVSGATFTSADAGRYLDLRGDATNTSNNGRFPIIGQVTSTIVVIGNPAAQTSTFTGSFATLAGAGPVPNGPAFLEATDNVTIALSPGGANNFVTFSQTGMHGVAPFALTTASAALIRAIPTDGSAITLACDDQNGNVCDGVLTIFSMETTDGSTSGLPEYIMPPPVTHLARVNCAFIGHTADIPANIMQVVMAATPTRIQSFFSRVNFAQTADSNQTSFALGRAIAGFTTP